MVKGAGASGWPPALAGVKVGDEWFISLFSLCTFMFLSERDLYFYVHYSVLRCKLSVADSQWDDLVINHLTPKDPYSGRLAPLTSKCCILYIYSTNISNEYFKHGMYCPFFFSSKYSVFHSSNLFESCFIHILYTECAKIKKKNSGTKRLKAA